MVQEGLKVPARVWRDGFTGLLLDDHTGNWRHPGTEPARIGDKDALIGSEQQDVLTRGITGARLVAYPGVGHPPHWDAPERFAADLTAFVSSIDRAR